MIAFYLFLGFALLWYFLFRENFLNHTYRISTGTTRNMSYDIRGDVPIPMGYVGPWNIDTIHYNPNEYFNSYGQSNRMQSHFHDNYYYNKYWDTSYGIVT